MDDTVHATAVAWADRACLITGPSGSGKSSLAIEMIALGCTLICDDRVTLSRRDNSLIASPARNIAGLIEARGIGLLTVPVQDPAAVAFCIDLSSSTSTRLPPAQSRDLLGLAIPVMCSAYRPGLAAAVLLALRHGIADPDRTGGGET